MDRRVKERLVGATILVVLIVLIVPEMLSGPKERVTVPPAPAAGQAQPTRNVTVDLATSKATPAEAVLAASAGAPNSESTPSGETAGASGEPGSGEPASGLPATGPAATGAPATSEAASGELVSGEPATGAPPGDETAKAGVESGPFRGGHATPPPTIATLKAQQPVKAPVESEPPIPKSTAATSKPGPAREGALAEKPHHHWAVQLGSFASRANAEKLMRRARAHDASVYVSSSGKGAALRYRVRSGPLPDRGAAERMMAKFTKEGLSASLVPP